jgi:glycopeptide antibiotics resistance protein
MRQAPGIAHISGHGRRIDRRDRAGVVGRGNGAGLLVALVALTAIVLPSNRSIYTALTLGLGAVITFLELYPFHFRVPTSGLGALHTLLKSWADRPPPGDFLRNIVAYVPLGFCATMALGHPRPSSGWAVVVVLGCTFCSVSFELTQYFIPGRFTSAMDVYADTFGALIGSAAAVFLGCGRTSK